MSTTRTYFVKNLRSASLCDSPFKGEPQGHNVHTRSGLAYERKVGEAILKSNHFPPTSVMRNPWFRFEDDFGEHYCSPDLLISLVNGEKIVVEIKLAYKLEAEVKLKNLYFPVIRHAFNTTPGLLIISKKLTADAPEPSLLLRTTMNLHLTPSSDSRVPVVQWLGRGAI